ncbi:MAG: S-layer homology domain-containing protein [Lachnospiraceae bacterium]|nr:S-layer homology domain-containing protein [Lachnospiraceae bacterium]
MVDGKSVGAKGSYTFKDVTKNYTLKVIFKETVKEINPYVEPQTVVAFDDVNEKDWFADAVYAAVNNGWFSGTSKTTFSPYVTTTREQMAAILYRYAQLKGYDVSKTASLDSFTDRDSTSQYVKTSMAWAVANQLITGKGNSTLHCSPSKEHPQIFSG